MVAVSATAGTVCALVASLVGSWAGVHAYKQSRNKKRRNKPWFEWTEDDVAEFVSSMGHTQRWSVQYPAIIFRHDLDGHALQQISTEDLEDIGFTERDSKKILRAFAAKVKLVGFPKCRE